MSENKVNGPEDAVVSEMIKQLPREKIRRQKMLSRTDYWAGTMRPARGGL